METKLETKTMNKTTKDCTYVGIVGTCPQVGDVVGDGVEVHVDVGGPSHVPEHVRTARFVAAKSENFMRKSGSQSAIIL